MLIVISFVSDQTSKFLEQANRKKIKDLLVISPTTVFKDEYIIQEGNYRVTVKKTGGHTADSSFIYSPEHKLLIAGDNLRSDFLWGGKQGNSEKWLTAFQEYLSLDTKFIIAGHGEITKRNEVEALISLIKEMKRLTLDLAGKKKSKKDIIFQLNDMQPPKETSIFIHDTTVTKWAKFWIRSIKK